MSRLNEMILEFRENIGQSIEGIALLMKMEPEEYAELEKEWIPPDNILKKICTLFDWNYNEIKKIVENYPSKKTKKNNLEPKSNLLVGNFFNYDVAPFSKMIIEARNEARQDEKGIATLMGISVEYYKEIEEGLLPPNELIRKLCTLFGWNYNEIKQKINAQSKIKFDKRQPIIDPRKIKKPFPETELSLEIDFEPPVSLNEQIYKARMEADQSVEGISLLLQINQELYEQIESGIVKPDHGLLKRMSSLFGWNYHEMLIREKSSNYGQLLPAITKLDSKDSSISEMKLRKIQQEIEEKWINISPENQETLLTQLEFLLGSMENLNQSE